MVRLYLWNPGSAWLVLAIYTALGLVAVIAVGATDGVRRVSPVTNESWNWPTAQPRGRIPLLPWIACAYDLLPSAPALALAAVGRSQLTVRTAIPPIR